MSESMLEVIPEAIRAELLLTADTAISHHDPAVQDDSNRSLFNRQKQLWQAGEAPALPTQEQIDALAEAYPVPVKLADLLGDLSLPEYVATCLTRLFVRIYNRRNAGAGEGLFTGLERYARLETRIRHAAVRSNGLRAWWNRLVDSMVVTIHEHWHDEELLPLLSLPRGLQQLVLETMVRDYRSIVALARAWAQEARDDEERTALAFDAAGLKQPGGVEVLEVPAVSGNALRHEVVRWPAWLHLCRCLGLDPAAPGQGPVPPGVEAIFVNGGNIASGAKQPTNPFGMAQAIRAAYPSLDLLGGVTDSFDLGESRLSVAALLVCRENAAALAGSPAADLPLAQVSAFDLLDDRTETRQAHAGIGQMIRSFEVICPGAQVLCRLVLEPHTPLLTRGALVCAVREFLAQAPFVGGQGARGFGWVSGEWLQALEDPGAKDAYEAYLRENKDRLRQGLVDGTLCAGQVVLL